METVRAIGVRYISDKDVIMFTLEQPFRNSERVFINAKVVVAKIMHKYPNISKWFGILKRDAKLYNIGLAFSLAFTSKLILVYNSEKDYIVLDDVVLDEKFVKKMVEQRNADYKAFVENHL